MSDHPRSVVRSLHMDWLADGAVVYTITLPDCLPLAEGLSCRVITVPRRGWQSDFEVAAEGVDLMHETDRSRAH